MIGVKVKSGDGSGRELFIQEDGSIPVVIHGHPPTNQDTFLQLPTAQFFLNGVSNDMRVNGSTNNIDFSVDARSDEDVYITSITIQISDVGAQLDEFGAIAELTNGLQFIYKNNALGDLVLQDSITTNLSFFREATAGKGFGDGVSAWRADVAGGGGQDTYFPEIDMMARYGLRYGLRLVKGSTAKLIYRVRDNITAIDVFNIKAHGFVVREV